MANGRDEDRALAELYRKHRQGLFTLSLTITRSVSLAEDAIQDAFVRLARRPIVAEDPAAYVFAAVRNAARDLTTRRRTSDLPPDLFDHAAGPEQAAISGELAGIVRKCLADLDADSREAVVMKLWGDMTFEQIAAITGEPLQTIASRYRRALIRIKELIGTKV